VPVQKPANNKIANWRQRRPSACLAIPTLTSTLGSATGTLNSNKYHAYANEFTVAVEDPDLGKMRNISQETTGLMWGHDFGWKTFWNSNPESSCLKLTIDKWRWNLSTLRGRSTVTSTEYSHVPFYLGHLIILPTISVYMSIYSLSNV